MRAHPKLQVIEKKHPSAADLILIVDKGGFLGEAIARKLHKGSLVAYVGEEEPTGIGADILFIPYKRRIPAIPQDSYSFMILVYSGEREIVDLLPSFVKEAQKSHAKILFIIHFAFWDEEVVNIIQQHHKETLLIVIGDIFGTKDNITKLDRFLYLAKRTKQVVLSEIGLTKLYPVFIDDALDSILQLAFSQTLSPTAFALMPKQPVSELSLARNLQKIDPLIRVDFSSQKKQKPMPDTILPADTIFPLGESYSFEKSLKEFFDNLDTTVSPIFKEPPPTQSPFSYQKMRFLLPFAFLFLFMLFIFPFLATFAFGFLGASQLQTAKNAILEENNLSKAHFAAGRAKSLLANAEFFSQSVLFEAGIIRQEQALRPYLAKLHVAREASETLSVALSVGNNLLQILSGQKEVSKDEFLVYSQSLREALLQLQKLHVEQRDTDIGKDLAKLTYSTKHFSDIITVLPILLGYEKKREYLILFQNNMELRPGGGFIGSYGLLPLARGKIGELTIHDVYDADGQLKGHVEPPFAFRRYMGNVHWYLRDSNFDIDFRKNASVSAFFLKEETGQEVDGVVSVDVAFLQDLLGVVGPVFVSDYKETATKDNVYILAQKHAEKDSFAGSRQKKDFLRALFISLKLQLSTQKNIPYLPFLEALSRAIKQKHIQIGFSDPALQQLFATSGMSSAVIDTRGVGNDTVNDFLGVIDANIGANKANAFVKRNVTQEVAIDQKGVVSEKVTIVYKNESKDWPGGEYKNFLQLVVPNGSKLTSISIDGKEEKIVTATTDPSVYEQKNFKPPSGLEVETTEKNGKTVFGFFVVVPMGSQKTVTVSYSLQNTVSQDASSFRYSNIVFKQPGTNADLYGFTIVYPKTFRLVEGKEKEIVQLGEDIQKNLLFSKI